MEMEVEVEGEGGLYLLTQVAAISMFEVDHL